jgi:hypothetical protein
MSDDRLCYGVHLYGAQGDGPDRLPTFGEAQRELAMVSASMLKRADPEALVTVVVWEDDGAPWVARDDDEAFAAMAAVLMTAAWMRAERVDALEREVLGRPEEAS